MKDIEKQPHFLIQKELAIKEAKTRGLSEEEIERRANSPLDFFGQIIRQRMNTKKLDTQTFSEKTGVNEEDLRAICYGYADADIARDRFLPISEALDISDEGIKALEKAFPFLRADS